MLPTPTKKEEVPHIDADGILRVPPELLESTTEDPGENQSFCEVIEIYVIS